MKPKTPLSSLLFKTETMREPLTEDNTGRLDDILVRVVGKPFQVLVLIVFIGGIQGVNFWIN